MKNSLRSLAGMLALVTLAGHAAPVTAFAAEPEYTYTITLAMGRIGNETGSGITVAGDNDYSLTASDGLVTLSGLNAGARVSINAQDAATLPEDSKYYLRGVRISGRDNTTADVNSAEYNAEYTSPSFAVNADADYVIAYGIKGELTQYTVNFWDSQGKALAESRTYYGNIGDQPVVAYLYIDGYRPQAYNLTKTLVADSSQNVFTFVYTPIAAPTAAQPGSTTGGGNTTATVTQDNNTATTDETTTPDGTDEAAPGTTGTTGATGGAAGAAGTAGTTGATAGTTAGGNAAAGGAGAAGAANGAAGNAQPADGNAAGAAGDNADASGAADNANGNGDAAQNNEPQELINIDENETPLASGTEGAANGAAAADAQSAGLPVVPIAAGAGVLALVALVVLFLKKKKQDKKGDSK